VACATQDDAPTSASRKARRSRGGRAHRCASLKRGSRGSKRCKSTLHVVDHETETIVVKKGNCRARSASSKIFSTFFLDGAGAGMALVIFLRPRRGCRDFSIL